jgi:type I restriction-modification system DNA methylase subunit
MDAAEYKHVVARLIFIKYISGASESKHTELEAQKSQRADPEVPRELLRTGRINGSLN